MHWRSVVAGLSFLAIATHGNAAESPWSLAARLPEARAELSVAEVNGKIYVVGGAIGSEGATTKVEEFDPATKQVRPRAPLPHALTHVGLTSLGGKLYAIGGFEDDVHERAQALAYVYDPAADRWQDLPPLPSPRGSPGVAALNGKLHVVGG